MLLFFKGSRESNDLLSKPTLFKIQNKLPSKLTKKCHLSLQPTFYHMGHFSRFVEPGSIRVSTKVDRTSSLEYIAFVTPSKARILVILNRKPKAFVVQVSEQGFGEFVWNVPARSIQTFKWNP